MTQATEPKPKLKPKSEFDIRQLPVSGKYQARFLLGGKTIFVSEPQATKEAAQAAITTLRTFGPYAETVDQTEE